MGKEKLSAYETDSSGVEGKTSKVFFPENIQEVRQIVKENQHLTIRGAGTGLAGGAIPQNEAVIDLSKMNKILRFDEENKLIEIEPGLMLDELNEFLSKYNLEFPVKPGSHSSCSIGGMIAVNAAGERAVKYGKTGKWIEGLDVVDAQGELISVKKFELNDFIGLEGITGIIVKAKLKLINRKKRTADLLSLNSIKEVIENIEKYGMLQGISEVEFLDKFTSSLLGLGESYHLIFEFEDERGALKEKEYEDIMRKRDSVYPVLARVGFTRIEDPKISLNRFEELALMLENMKIPYYGHLGAGIIHPVFKENEENKIKLVMSFVKKIKGIVSGEHGIGLLKKEFLEDSEKKLLIKLKQRYDPSNKLNQGKVIDLETIKLNPAEERRLENLEKVEEIIKEQNEENEQ